MPVHLNRAVFEQDRRTIPGHGGKTEELRQAVGKVGQDGVKVGEERDEGIERAGANSGRAPRLLLRELPGAGVAHVCVDGRSQFDHQPGDAGKIQALLKAGDLFSSSYDRFDQRAARLVQVPQPASTGAVQDGQRPARDVGELVD